MILCPVHALKQVINVTLSALNFYTFPASTLPFIANKKRIQKAEEEEVKLFQPPTSSVITQGTVLACPIKYNMKINQSAEAPIKSVSF